MLFCKQSQDTKPRCKLFVIFLHLAHYIKKCEYKTQAKTTWPAWLTVFSSLCKSAGSAGISTATDLVSTATRPTGIPPNLALPTMTDLAQPFRISSNVSLSKKPDTQSFFSVEWLDIYFTSWAMNHWIKTHKLAELMLHIENLGCGRLLTYDGDHMHTWWE